MKYALISDIHANLPALEAVLTDIARRQDVGATYRLGDLVGYAPWPDDTVALIERAGIPGVAGNYVVNASLAAAGPRDPVLVARAAVVPWLAEEPRGADRLGQIVRQETVQPTHSASQEQSCRRP